MSEKRNMLENKKTDAENFQDFIYRREGRRQFYKFVEEIERDDDLTEAVTRIFDIIDENVFGEFKDQFVVLLPADTIIYRARIIEGPDYKKGKGLYADEDLKTHGYDERGSREPMLGIAKEGRNNIAGASYFYGAAEPLTACLEVKSTLFDMISLAEFKTTRDIEIVDFATDKDFQGQDKRGNGFDLVGFFSEMMLRFGLPANGEKTYRATQIIADYIRKSGVDWMAYLSSLNFPEKNYTIFNCHPSILDFKGSRIVWHAGEKQSFWDFSNRNALVSNEENAGMPFRENTAQVICGELGRVFCVDASSANRNSTKQ